VNWAANHLVRVLDFVAGVAFVAALVAFPISLCNLGRHSIRNLLIFGISLLTFFCACETSQNMAQAQIVEKLEAISEKYQIFLNGKSAPNSHEILLALKTLKWPPDHHSHPTKRINVEISDDSRRIILSLARDSGDPREYWVFYPKYFITKYNEIGRIVTPVFDNY
jgi:hypothetical protein